MVHLGEISTLARLVNKGWQSPVADAVAARWDRPAGTARWWRSSASHVFVLPDTPVAAVQHLADRLAALPATPTTMASSTATSSWTNFELDNLSWEGNTPTAFGFDEAALSW
ncbi:hypothetical protein [Streptomyces sp. G45]|uniref:hypothetical protein n=1 Tax=Streptomyces sp. G45 TaxID=3406627 RepID=UPI003C1AF940